MLQLCLLFTVISLANVVPTFGINAATSTLDLAGADTTVDVAILGSGISGLHAARNLAKSGYSVAVFEALDRLGGRSERIELLTNTSSPLFLDEGGMWVGPTQNEFVKLINELNLTLYPSSHFMGDVAVIWDNITFGYPDVCWDCLALPDPSKGDLESAEILRQAAAHAPTPEMQQGLTELVKVMTALRQIVNTIDPREPWNAPNAEELDRITFEEWLHSQTDSPLARALIEVATRIQGTTNCDMSWVSVLHVARQLAASPQSQIPEKWLIQGGAGQIPSLLAQQVESYGGEIILGAPVRLIQQNEFGVVIHSDSRTVAAKAVIVAMPPHLAGRMQYEPALPPLRDQLTQRTFMGSIIKCIAVYETPFWRNGTSRGNSFVFGPQTRGAVATAFDVSPPSPKGSNSTGVGILATFIASNFPQYYSMTDEERKKEVLKSFAEFYGLKALKPIAFVQKMWAADPFTGGGYSSIMPPGTWTNFGKFLTEPCGKIFWAGTEVSHRWPGFYEGAIQAANDAVEAVKELVEPTGEYSRSEKWLKGGMFVDAWNAAVTAMAGALA